MSRRCPACGRIQTPMLAVDGIVLRRNGKIVLIRRANEPYRGKLALPGGFVEIGESVEDAVRREVREETGLETEIIRLVGVYSDPERDPRGHVVSVCFLLREIGGSLKAGSDAREVIEIEPEKIKKEDLAFDHAEMLRDAGVLR